MDDELCPQPTLEYAGEQGHVGGLVVPLGNGTFESQKFCARTISPLGEAARTSYVPLL